MRCAALRGARTRWRTLHHHHSTTTAAWEPPKHQTNSWTRRSRAPARHIGIPHPVPPCRTGSGVIQPAPVVETPRWVHVPFDPLDELITLSLSVPSAMTAPPRMCPVPERCCPGFTSNWSSDVAVSCSGTTLSNPQPPSLSHLPCNTYTRQKYLVANWSRWNDRNR